MIVEFINKYWKFEITDTTPIPCRKNKCIFNLFTHLHNVETEEWKWH